MAYIFECDSCGAREPIDILEIMFEPLQTNCSDCGQDGCLNCMPYGLCYNCRDDENELDNPDRSS